MIRFLIISLKVFLPLLVIAGAVFAALEMFESRPEVEKRPSPVLRPKVRVQAVAAESTTLTVHSQGTVRPATESRLVPEVSGRIVSVSPSFVPGGFFEAGDVLFKIDDRDHEQAIVLARAEVTRTRLRLTQEEAEAKVAKEQWDDVGKGEASPLTLRAPQLSAARASLSAAEAKLEMAERDLARTEVKAPFKGRVRRKTIDVGQFATRGMPVAVLYAVDRVEISLPLADRDLAFIDLPLDFYGDDRTRPGPPVTVRATFAGRDHEWQGRIVRTEGEIDATTRLVHVVAAVDDPYGRSEEAPDRPPLAVGMYVRAEIEGRLVDNAIVLPRSAMRGRNRVVVVDGDDRLRFREVDILRKTGEEVVIPGGLEPGERVCVSPLEAIVDGMQVEVVEQSDNREDS